MRKFYKYFFLIFLLMVGGCKKINNSITPIYKYSLVFSANTQGNIKNCFCRIRRGGLSERSFLINDIKKHSEKYFIFDCGNSISEDFISKEKLLHLMEYIGYSAYFVTAFEYKDDRVFYQLLPQKTKMQISSFTILGDNGKELFLPYIEKNILGKKVAFLSITGFSKLPGYYHDIKLKTLDTAIKELKPLSKKFDKLFIITDYPQMEAELTKNGIKNILGLFQLNYINKIVDTDWNGGKILSLILSGKFFWHIAVGLDDNKFVISENLVEVKEDIGHDKYIDKEIGD